MPARSQYSAENIPFPTSLVFITSDGETLCNVCAERHTQHMVRVKVTGYASVNDEVCDRCNLIIA